MPACAQYAIISLKGIGPTPLKPSGLLFRNVWNADHAKRFRGNGLSLIFSAPFAIKYASSFGVYWYDQRSALISFFPFPYLLLLRNSLNLQRMMQNQ